MSGYGKIYESSYWGVGVCENTIGWGSSYKSIANCTDASFSYPQDSYPTNGVNPTPTITGDAGGTFTATPSGLTLNASTGEITLSTSTVNSYTIRYTLPDATFAEQSMQITAPPFSNTRSFEFDGIDDYMTTSLDGTSTGGILAASDSDVAVSVSFWFKLNNTSSGEGIWQWANQLSSLSPFILFRTASGPDRVRFYVDGAYQALQAINLSQWYHVVLTRTASDNTWRGYLDGNNTAWFTKDDGGAISARSSATDIYFGNGYNGYAPCSIDEFAVWNTTLNQAAITEIYNSGVPNDLDSLSNASSPTVWYRMGE